MWQTRSRKWLTKLTCLLQRSLWNVVFLKSSMLHTLTLLECQHIFKYLKKGPRIKLFLISSLGEKKLSRDQRAGSRKATRRRLQVRDRFRRLFLSKNEKRWSRHSWLRSMRCIAKRVKASNRLLCAGLRSSLLIHTEQQQLLGMQSVLQGLDTWFLCGQALPHTQ